MKAECVIDYSATVAGQEGCSEMFIIKRQASEVPSLIVPQKRISEAKEQYTRKNLPYASCPCFRGIAETA
ncbi:hypothetical protein CHS0354_034336 [Potamilus streckersoni]|uniref:Uncharacterized protein n=1 Tax=Potamilus streckersoni TaxID=2493646 RepID=A0AAE0W721_9BIVA|nr:hypothetical protein CHS0354_034336 [Potamilus streckersoni]